MGDDKESRKDKSDEFILSGVNSKNKRYQCTQCSFYSNKQSQLSLHQRFGHNDSNAFKCCLCNYSANDESKLKYHLKLPHKKANTCQCDQCDFVAFSSKEISWH